MEAYYNHIQITFIDLMKGAKKAGLSDHVDAFRALLSAFLDDEDVRNAMILAILIQNEIQLHEYLLEDEDD